MRNSPGPESRVQSPQDAIWIFVPRPFARNVWFDINGGSPAFLFGTDAESVNENLPTKLSKTECNDLRMIIYMDVNTIFGTGRWSTAHLSTAKSILKRRNYEDICKNPVASTFLFGLGVLAKALHSIDISLTSVVTHRSYSHPRVNLS